MNHKESKSTPTHVVAVIGGTHLDSTVTANQQTKRQPNDTKISLLCNQIYHNKNITEEAQTQREELLILRQKETIYTVSICKVEKTAKAIVEK